MNNIMKYSVPFLLFSLNVFTSLKVFFVFLYFLIKGVQGKKILFDSASVFLLFFLVIYSSFVFYSLEKIQISEIFSLFFILFSYLIGLNFKLKPNEYILSIKSALFSISLLPILSIMIETYFNGFEGGNRSIYFFYDKSLLISATVMGGFLFLPVVFLALNFYKINIINLLISGLVVFCILRLGSRTLVFLALIMILYGFLWSLFQRRRIYSFCVIGVFSFLTFNYYEKFLYYFNDRLDSSEAGISTAGGRLERWSYSIDYLFQYPFGWNIDLIGYSHNVFLDIARVGGLISMIMFLIVTAIIGFRLFKDVKLIKDKEIRFIGVCLLLIFPIVAMLEPLMDGFIYFLAVYLFIVGLVRNFTLNFK